MTFTYFLGANSRRGFFSLYHDFPPASDAFLHILKSGPGTGKSGFLRRIGQEAEAREMDVHYVLCSGDPDSLDGVYIPDLKQAWVDGTAPHVIEPRIFGADTDYVNLGAFFRRSFDRQEIARLKELNSAYKERYRSAYRLLEEYAAVKTVSPSRASDGEGYAVINALPQRSGHGLLYRRYLSAITCKGFMRLTEQLNCYQCLPCSEKILYDGVRTILEKAWNAILCPSSLDPERFEALLIPEAKIALTAFSEWNDPIAPALENALQELRAAKALHDELEAIYHPHISFKALDEYTDSVLSRIFPRDRS